VARESREQRVESRVSSESSVTVFATNTQSKNWPLRRIGSIRWIYDWRAMFRVGPTLVPRAILAGRIRCG
jgi:hypothetical protein